MSEFDLFLVELAENDSKTAKSHVSSLKGDLWPKLTSGRDQNDLWEVKLTFEGSEGPLGGVLRPLGGQNGCYPSSITF